jgi:GNAT superfamily N-acetyltransferase
VDDGARPLGAAWYRHFAADAPGYGFVSEDVPELAIAVVLEARGRGVGRAVLGGLIATAREGGELALSLDVSALNPIAVRLYRSLGFVRVGGTDENPVMVLRLDEPASGRDAERDEKSPQVRR